jgi:hypothetical protein
MSRHCRSVIGGGGTTCRNVCICVFRNLSNQQRNPQMRLIDRRSRNVSTEDGPGTSSSQSKETAPPKIFLPHKSSDSLGDALMPSPAATSGRTPTEIAAGDRTQMLCSVS